MCEHALAGRGADHGCDDHDGGEGDATGHVGPQRGKPTVIVHVDVADTTATCAGQVELNVTGGDLPDITKTRLEEILSNDHDLRVVLFDDGRPLAVSDLIHADDIPTKTRIHELGVIRSDGARASRRRRRCDGATRRKREGEGAPPEDRMIPSDPWGTPLRRPPDEHDP